VDTLPTNAVHSIESGVEDFRSTDLRRLISALRNVQAGILLLCKKQLRQLSPSYATIALTNAETIFAMPAMRHVEWQML